HGPLRLRADRGDGHARLAEGDDPRRPRRLTTQGATPPWWPSSEVGQSGAPSVAPRVWEDRLPPVTPRRLGRLMLLQQHGSSQSHRGQAGAYLYERAQAGFTVARYGRVSNPRPGEDGAQPEEGAPGVLPALPPPPAGGHGVSAY